MRSLPILASLISFAAFARAETYDLLIRGGRVVDGTGSPASFADVAVKDGHIAAIGKLDGGATIRPLTSSVVVASPESFPIAAIRPSFSATSAKQAGLPVPSTTRPPRMSRS